MKTNDFRTWLYVKRCNHCGLLYFGKTVRDPYTYLGSGSKWIKHMQRHGKEHIETLKVKLYTDEERCMRAALNFSEEHDIVKARREDGRKIWANLVPENGLDGGLGTSTLSRYKQKKIGRGNRGKKMFNDGVRHYMLQEDDPLIKKMQLCPGRTKQTRLKMSHPKSKKPELSQRERARRADRMRYAGAFRPVGYGSRGGTTRLNRLT